MSEIVDLIIRLSDLAQHAINAMNSTIRLKVSPPQLKKTIEAGYFIAGFISDSKHKLIEKSEPSRDYYRELGWLEGRQQILNHQLNYLREAYRKIGQRGGDEKPKFDSQNLQEFMNNHSDQADKIRNSIERGWDNLGKYADKTGYDMKQISRDFQNKIKTIRGGADSIEKVVLFWSNNCPPSTKYYNNAWNGDRDSMRSKGIPCQEVNLGKEQLPSYARGLVNQTPSFVVIKNGKPILVTDPSMLPQYF